jgi:hypothetical protein
MQCSIKRQSAVIRWVIAMTMAASMALFSTASFAQNEREASARALVLESLTTSHLAEVYGDMRKYIHAVMIPIIQDISAGKTPMPPMRDPLARDYMDEVFKLYTLIDKSGDDVDLAMQKHRDEIVDDLARIVAKHLSAEEIEAVRAGLRLQVTRKSFDLLQNVYHQAFNKSAADARSMMEFGAWMQELMTSYRERGRKPVNPAPTAEQITKATVLTNELWASARVDDLVAASMHIARLIATSVTTGSERDAALAKLDEFKQQYATMKPMWSIMMATWMATMLNDEQMTQLQGFAHGPSAALFYEVFVSMGQEMMSVTQSDIDATTSYLIGTRAQGLPRERSPEEIAAVTTDITAFSDQWGTKLTEGLAPEVREALTATVKRVAELYLKQLNALEGKAP